MSLNGIRVVVTRAQDQAGGFREALEAFGAVVVMRPLIRIDPPPAAERLVAAARSASDYDWIIFTSANAVDRFVGALEAVEQAPRELKARVAAVGPATGAVLAARGIEVHVLPAEYTAGAVAAALASAADLNGARVLWPCGATARTELADVLTRRGARIDPVVTYQTVIDHAAGAALRGEVAAGAFDVVTFTSPSTVRAFAERGEVVLGGTRIATIGPVTAREAGRWGLPVDIEPRDHTTTGLARAIDRYYGAAPRQAADREDEP